MVSRYAETTWVAMEKCLGSVLHFMNPLTYLSIAISCFSISLCYELWERKFDNNHRNLLRGSGFWLCGGVISLAMFVSGVTDWLML